MWYAIRYGEITRDLPAKELGQEHQHSRGRYHCTQRDHQRILHNTDSVIFPPASNRSVIALHKSPIFSPSITR